MTNSPISPQEQARILSEALPHMQQYDEETIVIKYGGHAMGEEELARQFARDIVLLEQTAINPVVVLGFVGEPKQVDLKLLNQLIGYELIPVLAPLATSATGETFNVNADTFAGAVAGALKAKRLLLLTDVPGVLDKSKKLITDLSVRDARKLIADGTISGGMIPKVETCIYALDPGVEGVVIIDGKTQHAVLLELFTNQGTGTLIHK